MFDGIQLFRENGYQYKYKEGNLIQNTNPEGKSTGNTYNGNNLISSQDENAFGTQHKWSYTYESKNNLKTVTSPEGIVNTYGYDGAGNITVYKLGDDDLKILTNSSYDSAVSGTEYKGSNYLKTITDPVGNTVTYNNDWRTGNLTSFINAAGKRISYQYDNMNRLKEVTASASRITVSNTYGYTDPSGNITDQLQTIGHNGFIYRFQYDSLGNVTGISAAGKNLVTNEYSGHADETGSTYNTNRLKQTQYGNGQKISFDYDPLNRMTAKNVNGIKRYTYDYDENGNVALITDSRDNSMTRYFYSLADRLSGILDPFGIKTDFIYDNVGNVKSINETINSQTFGTAYHYNWDNIPTKVSYRESVLEYNYTDLEFGKDIGRLAGKSIKVNNVNIFNTGYTYKRSYISGNTSTQALDQINNNGKTIQYSYDQNGNIKTITSAGSTTSYDYNELNELIRENNPVTGKTVLYTYDAGGNITSKTEYLYTTGTPSNAIKTYNYTYDNTWRDLLKNYDGKAVDYDAIGNPSKYDGWDYSWEEGRQLASMTKTGKSIYYKYNADGIRTEKTVNGKTTKYHIIGDKVTYETDGIDIIYYTYDSADNLISMNLNGTEYYYIRNGQNDIIGLFDSTGTPVVSYTYDAWGMLSVDGSLKNTVGKINPYRYRGYRYDSETGLY